MYLFRYMYVVNSLIIMNYTITFYRYMFRCKFSVKQVTPNTKRNLNSVPIEFFAFVFRKHFPLLQILMDIRSEV